MDSLTRWGIVHFWNGWVKILSRKIHGWRILDLSSAPRGFQAWQFHVGRVLAIKDAFRFTKCLCNNWKEDAKSFYSIANDSIDILKKEPLFQTVLRESAVKQIFDGFTKSTLST